MPQYTGYEVKPTHIVPLFVVTGQSGAGKTAVIPALRRRLPECLVFDVDTLWWPPGGAEHFYNNWFRLFGEVAQCGRHSVICGTLMPWNLDRCAERWRVGTIHYLNLHCSDEVRARRLRARPAKRNCTEQFIEAQIRGAHRLLEVAHTAFEPPLVTLDTTATPVEEVAAAIAQWVLSILGDGVTRAPGSRRNSPDIF